MADLPLSAKVALDVSAYWLDQPYNYAIPDELIHSLQPGMRVVVPFSRGNRPTDGIVLSIEEYTGERKLKTILSVPDRERVLDDKMLRLAFWMRQRYFCTVYEAARAMLPLGLLHGLKDKTIRLVSLQISTSEAAELAERKEKKAPLQSAVLRLLSELQYVSSSELQHFTGASSQTIKALQNAGIVSVHVEQTYRRPQFSIGESLPLPVLNEAQQTAYDSILELFDGTNPSASLLYGVTGSGKTSVYIRLIHSMLEKGKSSILLVPEISLTPQMIRIFSSYFGESIAVVHSALAEGERFDEWKRIRAGKARVVIGTRSAVFSPCVDLGLIIIDEEQEYTYKSENNPRYHARDVAKFRCSQNGAVLLLGSATPDLESMYHAKQGDYHMFSLPGRYNEHELPSVEIVDLREELKAGNGGVISRRLYELMAENLRHDEQSILFLNRRGTYSMISCTECGYTYTCPNCSVNLTYHGYGNKLICHHCGYTQRVDERCPLCGGPLKHFGTGTQKVEEELQQLFPETEVIRMDADSVAPAGSHERLLTEFREKKIPVLLGTQMVTKGLDFENVTLVGVLNADQALYCGDYRASERCFSLITQVIGRSGRGNKPGKAVIQTFTPQNSVLRFAARQDYDSFYDSEIQFRQMQHCPPFADVITLTVSSENEEKVIKTCELLRKELKKNLSRRDDIMLLGPAPLPVLKVNNRFRYHLSIHGIIDRNVRALVSDLLIYFGREKDFRNVSVYADLNPYD